MWVGCKGSCGTLSWSRCRVDSRALLNDIPDSPWRSHCSAPATHETDQALNLSTGVPMRLMSSVLRPCLWLLLRQSEVRRQYAYCGPPAERGPL